MPDDVEHGVRIGTLCGDVHTFRSIESIVDHGCIELFNWRFRKTGCHARFPLHRRPHAVAVLQPDVVAHSDLIAIIEDR